MPQENPIWDIWIHNGVANLSIMSSLLLWQKLRAWSKWDMKLIVVPYKMISDCHAYMYMLSWFKKLEVAWSNQPTKKNMASYRGGGTLAYIPRSRGTFRMPAAPLPPPMIVITLNRDRPALVTQWYRHDISLEVVGHGCFPPRL